MVYVLKLDKDIVVFNVKVKRLRRLVLEREEQIYEIQLS